MIKQFLLLVSIEIKMEIGNIKTRKCEKCGKAITRQSKSGLCRKCCPNKTKK